MKIKITAVLFALTAFTVFAQPTLPTTNSYIVPIANPYSGSWIYYTTDSVSGLGFLNGASIPYVMTVSNNVVTYFNTLTNGLASTNYVLMIGLNDTNNTTSVSNLVYLAGQSYANGIGANATNNTASVSNLVYLAAQSYANGIGANATNNTASVSNSLATLATGVTTWGTTTNKPASAAPAKVYYYFTNGYPMFGIISTNN